MHVYPAAADTTDRSVRFTTSDGTVLDRAVPLDDDDITAIDTHRAVSAEHRAARELRNALANAIVTAAVAGGRRPAILIARRVTPGGRVRIHSKTLYIGGAWTGQQVQVGIYPAELDRTLHLVRLTNPDGDTVDRALDLDDEDITHLEEHQRAPG